MNITKEQMLERIREWKGAFDTHPDKMDEWSLCFMEDYKVYDAIRSLIESSGEKASGVGERPRIPSASELPEEWRKQLSAIEGHVCKPDDTCSCYQLADTPNEKCPVHGSGLWPAHCAECGRFLPAPSPGPRYDPDCQCADCRSDRARNGRPTIKPSLTVAPSPAPLPAEVEAAMERMDFAIGDAYSARQDLTTQKGYTRAKAKEDCDMDHAALAVIRAALSRKP